MAFQRAIEQVQIFVNTGYHLGDPRPVSCPDWQLPRDDDPRPMHLFESADTQSIFQVGPVIAVDAREKHAITALPSAVRQQDDLLQSRTWNIGNRMALDANDLPWPSYTRSLSIGDVALIRGTYYAVEPAGWRELGEPPLVRIAAWGERDEEIRRHGTRPSWRDGRHD